MHVSGPPLTDAEIEARFGTSEDGMFQRLVPARWEAAHEAGVCAVAAAWAPTASAVELRQLDPHALFTDVAGFHTWQVHQQHDEHRQRIDTRSGERSRNGAWGSTT